VSPDQLIRQLAQRARSKEEYAFLAAGAIPGSTGATVQTRRRCAAAERARPVLEARRRRLRLLERRNRLA
jgi:hypothetical protein